MADERFPCRSLPHDLFVVIALEIEGGDEIGVTYLGIGRSGGGGLRPERDTEAGAFDHRDVVGAVSDRDGVFWRDAEFTAVRLQDPGLGGGVDDASRELAGQSSVFGGQDVGMVRVHGEAGGDAFGDAGETTRHQHAAGAGPAHRRDQRAGARHQRGALLGDAVEHPERQPGKGADPLSERRLEVELAAHRGLGDGRDLGLPTGEIGDLVDAFGGDHRRIHVGDEQPLAPPGGRLHGEIDRFSRERPLERPARLAGCGSAERQVHGPRAEKDRRVETRAERIQGPFGDREQGGDAAGEIRLDDQGRDRIKWRAGWTVEHGDRSSSLPSGSVRRMPGHAGSRRRDGGGEMRCAIVIAGPTASGKSRLALRLAEEFGGTVVNADSMQVYRDLDILAARPGIDEMRRVPHRLFGVRDAALPASVGWWHAEAAREIRQAWLEGRVPVLVGGTGLYLESLFAGLSDIPRIPESVRRSVRLRLAEEGPRALHEELAHRDPASARRTSAGDRQRIARALEVLEATGRRLSEFLATRTPGALEQAHREGRVLRLVLAPPRTALYRRIEARFDRMMARGALDEVRALLARRLDPDLPAMKAIGVPPLAAHLRGECDLEEAVALAKRDSRRYAKRQMTWVRRRFADWCRPDWPASGTVDEALDRLADRVAGCFGRTVRPGSVREGRGETKRERGE